MDSRKFQVERQTESQKDRKSKDIYRDIGKFQTKGRQKRNETEKKHIRNVDQANRLTDRQTDRQTKCASHRHKR